MERDRKLSLKGLRDCRGKTVLPEQGKDTLPQDRERRERISRHTNHRFFSHAPDDRRFTGLYCNTMDEHLAKFRDDISGIVPRPR